MALDHTGRQRLPLLRRVQHLLGRRPDRADLPDHLPGAGVMRWHPLLLAAALAAAALGSAAVALVGAAFAPWLLIGVTAGFATSGST
ncbi:hypothetical protein GCM10009634_52580 [Saccharothrix xinjiangensis]